jgi:hypothetical protein
VAALLRESGSSIVVNPLLHFGHLFVEPEQGAMERVPYQPAFGLGEPWSEQLGSPIACRMFVMASSVVLELSEGPATARPAVRTLRQAGQTVCALHPPPLLRLDGLGRRSFRASADAVRWME